MNNTESDNPSHSISLREAAAFRGSFFGSIQGLGRTLALLLVSICSQAMAEVPMNPQKTLRDYAEYDERPVEKVVFKTVGDVELELWVTKPDGWAPGQKRPAMVWIHGGGWRNGNPGMMEPHMKYSAGRGAVGFSVQYRMLVGGGYKDKKELSDEENNENRRVKFETFKNGPSLRDLIADCEDAIRYIRKNSHELGVDPQRVIAIGDSAGAYLASSLATISTGNARVNAAVPCSSISDLTTGFGGKSVKPASIDLMGKPLSEDPERMARAKKLSPLFNITEDTPPILILKGKNDWLKEEPDVFHAALKEKGVDTEMITYPSGHAFIVYGYSAPLERITLALLDLDAFLVKRGLLDGPPNLVFPSGPKSGELLIAIEEPFKGPKSLKGEGDFPPFMTFSMKVKVPERFGGSLMKLPGKYGFNLVLQKKQLVFFAPGMRTKNQEMIPVPETCQDVRVALGKEKAVITLGDQTIEIPNKAGVSFISDEILLCEELNAEIKDLKIYSGPVPVDEIK